MKYWGKRDELHVLPMNGSISVTMDDTFRTRTTAMFSPNLTRDEVWLNSERLKGEELVKATGFLDLIRRKSRIELKAKIVSINGFPTAAGLASSASGWAALAYATTEALGLRLDSKEMSILSRLGSGSASRSVVGGFVEWKPGEKSDGSDCYAVQIAAPEHWAEIRDVVVIIDEKTKKVSSRMGMKQTVLTSSLYPKRIADIDKTLEVVRNAILEKDLPVLLQAMMRDSNSMHAVMLDTWPPIMYLNDSSREVIYAVHNFNADGIRVGYTFDAGPNAHIFTLERYVSEIKEILEEIEGVGKIIVCKVGHGPRIVKSDNEYLINSENGNIRRHYWDEKLSKITVEA